MPDNLRIRQPQDPTKINIHEEWEVRYWCSVLNVTTSQLIHAVHTVGVYVSDVRRYFGR